MNTFKFHKDFVNEAKSYQGSFIEYELNGSNLTMYIDTDNWKNNEEALHQITGLINGDNTPLIDTINDEIYSLGIRSISKIKLDRANSNDLTYTLTATAHK